jgi:hypothetical protein
VPSADSTLPQDLWSREFLATRHTPLSACTEETMKSSQAQARRELAVAMATGAAMGRITPSRLMSPTEIEVATRGRPDLEGKLQGWCLCTEVPDAMWQRALEARSREVPNQAMVVTGPSERRYLVVVVNAEGWQHRVCIPLLGELTAQWLDSLSTTRLMQMSVADAGSNRTFVTESVVPPNAIPQLSGFDTRIPDDLPHFLEEAFTLVAWNAAVATTDPVGQMALPSEVSLSLLLPAEVEAQLERRTEKWETRKPS